MTKAQVWNRTIEAMKEARDTIGEEWVPISIVVVKYNGGDSNPDLGSIFPDDFPASQRAELFKQLWLQYMTGKNEEVKIEVGGSRES